MTKVITYGTYDLLHYGHIRLLERAKALGDYLIVGVTSDDFDKARGKINVKQPLLERIAAVKATGIADEIVVEEYEGQKIDDIKRYDIDIFTVGSDWVGKFDYLEEYCKVVYLPRTEGVSSSELRAKQRTLRLGAVGESDTLIKFIKECSFVNGAELKSICTHNPDVISQLDSRQIAVTSQYREMLEHVDAVYMVSHPSEHFAQIREALLKGRHVLCESPITLSTDEFEDLFKLARDQGLVLMEALKTAYSTAYYRMLLLVKSGCIGQIASVDATCTSLAPTLQEPQAHTWNSICAWGPFAMLPIFQILGTDYLDRTICSCVVDKTGKFDIFTRINFRYPNAVASLKVGRGVKSEGDLVISGTRGYVYVPAPWWKTDYFEIRYENQTENKRYFYQLDGDGIRYEIANFVKSIETSRENIYIENNVSRAIVKIEEDFFKGENMQYIALK